MFARECGRIPCIPIRSYTTAHCIIQITLLIIYTFYVLTKLIFCFLDEFLRFSINYYNFSSSKNMSVAFSIPPPYMQPDDAEEHHQLLSLNEDNTMASDTFGYENKNPKNTKICRHQYAAVKVKSHSKCVYVWALLLFLFANPLLSIVPFCIEDLKETTVYCQKCKKQISSTRGRSKNAANCFLATLVMFFKIYHTLTKYIPL